jgi:hypothetical protein
MTEPTLTCPSCRTEIKLTESLAAPLIADTRRWYETQLAQKEAEVATREGAADDLARMVWCPRSILRRDRVSTSKLVGTFCVVTAPSRHPPGRAGQ